MCEGGEHFSSFSSLGVDMFLLSLERKKANASPSFVPTQRLQRHSKTTVIIICFSCLILAHMGGHPALKAVKRFKRVSPSKTSSASHETWKGRKGRGEEIPISKRSVSNKFQINLGPYS